MLFSVFISVNPFVSKVLSRPHSATTTRHTLGELTLGSLAVPLQVSRQGLLVWAGVSLVTQIPATQPSLWAGSSVKSALYWDRVRMGQGQRLLSRSLRWAHLYAPDRNASFSTSMDKSPLQVWEHMNYLLKHKEGRQFLKAISDRLPLVIEERRLPGDGGG